MRALLAVIVIAGLAWSGYWFVGSAGIERAIGAGLDALRDEGAEVAYADLSTTGFPNRFDTTITDITLSDPAGGVFWSAPFVQILALSYKPNHVIAVFPHDQTLGWPQDRIAIASDRMRGSVVFVPDTDLALDHSTFVADAVRLTGDAGWTLAAEQVRVATRARPGEADSHDIGIDIAALAPPDALRAIGGPGAAGSETIDHLRLDATATFDAPLDRFALREGLPRLTGLDLRAASMGWGRIGLEAAGTLAIDESGVPTGRITLSARNWREVLNLALAAGLLAEAVAEPLARGLQGGDAAGAEPLEVQLDFENGQVVFGSVPLGPAPRFR